MTRVGILIGMWLAGWATSLAWAGEVRLTLPDEVLREAITSVCLWHGCESPSQGGYKTDEEKARWVADWLIHHVSLGHYRDLSSLRGTMTVSYDE